jgi:hypothetical protein
MTNESAGDVGQVVVDEYLDAVERALIASHAPRSDRTQVVQDLESQIADMLAKEPQPLTEDAVRAVIARLEPPEHFAATYGNGQKTAASGERQATGWSAPKIGWAFVAAISCWAIPIGALLCLIAGDGPSDGGFVLFLMMMVACGVVFAPFALVKAVRELESQGPAKRDLVMFSAMIYSIVVPVLVLIFAVSVTRGAVLMALGVAAFVYFQYLLVRRVHRYFGRFALQREPAAPMASGVCAPTG